MKKLLAIIISVVILATTATTAFADYTEDVTFRGIPFGTTYGEIIDQHLADDWILQPEDIVWHEYGNANYNGIVSTKICTYTTIANYIDYIAVENEFPDQIGVGFLLRLEAPLSGVMNTIQLWFIYGVDDNGYIDTDIRNAKLYHAEYVGNKDSEGFTNTYVEQVTLAMKTKYGGTTGEWTIENYLTEGTTKKLMCWGMNNDDTWIKESYRMHEHGDIYTVTIGYYCTETTEWFNELQEAYNKELLDNTNLAEF